MARVHVSTVVWGDDYLDCLLRINLPCLLSPGNLPALARRHETVVRLTTTPAGAERIRGAPIYSRLASLIATEIAEIEDIEPAHGSRYETVGRLYNDDLRRAWEDEAWLISNAPDAVFPDGAMATMARIIRSDAFVICLGSLQVERGGFVRAFKERFAAQDGDVIAITPRELVSLAMEHPHPWISKCVVGGGDFTTWPSALYLPVPGEGQLMRVFHTAVVGLLQRRQVQIDPGDTIDMRFATKVVDSLDQIAYPTDSDDLCGINLVAADQPHYWQPGGLMREQLIEFVEKYTTAIHRDHVLKPFFCHYADITPEKWRGVVDSSERLLRDVLEASDTTNEL